MFYVIVGIIAGFIFITIVFLLKNKCKNNESEPKKNDDINFEILKKNVQPFLDDYYNQVMPYKIINFVNSNNKDFSDDFVSILHKKYGFIPIIPFIKWKEILEKDDIKYYFEMKELEKKVDIKAEKDAKEIVKSLFKKYNEIGKIE